MGDIQEVSLRTYCSHVAPLLKARGPLFADRWTFFVAVIRYGSVLLPRLPRITSENLASCDL